MTPPSRAGAKTAKTLAVAVVVGLGLGLLGGPMTALSSASHPGQPLSRARLAEIYLQDQRPLNQTLLKTDYDAVSLSILNRIINVPNDFYDTIDALTGFKDDLSTMKGRATAEVRSALQEDVSALKSYISALNNLTTLWAPLFQSSNAKTLRHAQARWNKATGEVAASLGLPTALSMNGSFSLAEAALPSLPGVPPSTTYPGTAANGWVLMDSHLSGFVIPTQGCQLLKTYELSWYQRDYSYNEEVHPAGYSVAGLSIGTYVAASAREAAEAQGRVFTKSYQSCFMEQNEEAMRSVGTTPSDGASVQWLDRTTNQSLGVSEDIIPAEAGPERTVYVETAFLHVGQYRALVSFSRSGVGVPLSYVEEVVGLLKTRMAAAPEGESLVWEF